MILFCFHRESTSPPSGIGIPVTSRPLLKKLALDAPGIPRWPIRRGDPSTSVGCSCEFGEPLEPDLDASWFETRCDTLASCPRSSFAIDRSKIRKDLFLQFIFCFFVGLGYGFLQYWYTLFNSNLRTSCPLSLLSLFLLYMMMIVTSLSL